MKDHQPIAVTRSRAGKAVRINAIALGPVAAPAAEPMNLKAINDPALHDRAAKPVNSVHTAHPMR